MRRAARVAAMVTALLTAAVTVVVTAGCSSTSAPPATVNHALAPSASQPRTSTSSPARPPHVLARVVARLPVGVSRSVVADLGSRLVVLGGLGSGDVTTDRVWAVDVGTGDVRRAGALAVAVHDASGVALHGHVLVFGGGAATTVATVQQWDGGRARVVGALPQPRSDSAAAVLGDTAYVVGGFDGTRMTRDVLATKDGVAFRPVGRLPVGVRYPAVVGVGDRFLVVVGGALATTEGTASGAQSDAVQVVDVRRGRAMVVARLPRPLAHATGCVVGQLPLVAGGRAGVMPTRAIVWTDPQFPDPRVAGRLPTALSDASCAGTGEASFLVGGEGADGPSAPLRDVVELRVTR